jgi:phage terminase large subunit-like protein
MEIKKYNYIARYWKKIQSGEIEVSEKVYKTMKMLTDIQEGKDKKYHFDPVLANRPIVFIENFCKQSKGHVGRDLKLELFQKAIVQATYGIVDKHGLRRFTEVFIVIGRKNGKSTLLSALGNYGLLGDKEGGPEIDCVSTKRDAAKIVFNSARDMVKQSPYLRKYIKSRKSDLYCEYNLGVFQPLSSDSNTIDGLNPSVVILDECHAIKDRNLYDVMKQAMAAESRQQPLFITITTSGFNRDGIYDELYEYAENILNGQINDEHFLSFIYELDSLDEWDKEDKWIKANPGIDTIKSRAKLRASVERAKSTPNYKPTVLTKDFNIKNIISSSWLTWQELNNEEVFDPNLLYDTYGIGGCDLSSTRDLTCASILVRRRGEDKIYLLQHYFLPSERVDMLEATNAKEAPYRLWSERGLLTLCEGNMVKYSDVTRWFAEMRDTYKIDLWRVGYDRALANYWVEEMKSEFGDVMEAVPQGPITWTAPMNELGGMLADKRVNYNNNPIFKWCLTNTAVKKTGTNEAIQPIKIQAHRRIDGLVSFLNAYTIYCKYRDDYLNMVG